MPAMPWFRQASTADVHVLLGRTLVQIIIFWGLFLYVLPPRIARLGASLGIAPLYVAQASGLAATLFVLASAVGLWSAFTMVTRGLGTPLPLDGPQRLVASGAYAWVRNPMAVAGLVQGAAVGIWLGSWLVIAYVVVGGVLWHVFVRPVEEHDLLLNFGEDYRAYRGRVPLWLPRRPRGAATPQRRDTHP